MTEQESIKDFVRIQKLEYYNIMLLILGEKFSERVKIGEVIDDGLRIEKSSEWLPKINPRDH